MKKILLAVCALFICSTVFAQSTVITNNFKNVAVKKTTVTGREEAAPLNVNPITRAHNNNFLGTTFYDLQTNGTQAQRIVAHSDGTVSAVWTTAGGTSQSRGTGYNYYNGSYWVNDASSTSRIENTRTGWGAIASIGNAEIVVSHNGTSALVISVCPQKGTQEWTSSTLQGPSIHGFNNQGQEGNTTALLWPAIATSGNTIHLIACTDSDTGFYYQGINTCLLYYRGTFDPANNTINWENPRIVGNVTASEVSKFSGDAYAIAAKDNTVAILVASTFSDVFIWKSIDNGVNFTKLTVAEHPYPGFNEKTTLVVDSPYVADGSCAVAIDATGKVHTAFGLTRMLNDVIADDTTSYFPGVEGLLYWTEDDQPILNPTRNTMDPDTLVAAGYKVFFRSDLNNDGGAYYAPEGYSTTSYGVSSISMPQILINGSNVYMFYSAYLDWPFQDHANSRMFRGVFGTKSSDNGANWGGVSWLSYNKDCYYVEDWTWLDDTTFTINDLLTVISTEGESVFPAVAQNVVNGKINMWWQQDYTSGCEVKENNVGICQSESNIYGLSIDANDIGVYNNTDEVWQGLWIDSTGISNHNISGMKMYPNPATETVNITFAAENAENGVLSVLNLMGQTVYTMRVDVNEGYNFVTVPVNQLPAGIYMVNIKTNKGISTQKLIVR